MNILNNIVIILFAIGIILIIISELLTMMNNNKPKNKNKFIAKPAILIPARDESKVIEKLLISIKNQTHKINMEDVYVIVEDAKDKTVDICKKYSSTVVIRKNLENRRRKGYALDDVVKYILKIKKKYDLYFIFDADNILDKNYLKEMLKTYEEGYDIGIGYRNCKNGNASVVAASSALVFSLVNTYSNTIKQKYGKNLTISGTGFYISGKYIEKWKGYPFNTLTEDYELTLYATLNNMTSYYNKNAIYYDEQPVKYTDTINQRTRWIKGYFEARGIYVKKILKSLTKKDNNYGSKLSECIGVVPYIFMILSFVTYLILQGLVIYASITSNNDILLAITIKNILLICLIIYLAILFLTIFLLIKENKTINFSFKTKIKTIFYFPIFLLSYIQCAIRALIIRDVSWKKIEHKENDII